MTDNFYFDRKKGTSLDYSLDIASVTFVLCVCERKEQIGKAKHETNENLDKSDKKIIWCPIVKFLSFPVMEIRHQIRLLEKIKI